MLDYLIHFLAIALGVAFFDWLISTRLAAYRYSYDYDYLPIKKSKIVSGTVLTLFIFCCFDIVTIDPSSNIQYLLFMLAYSVIVTVHLIVLLANVYANSTKIE